MTTIGIERYLPPGPCLVCGGPTYRAAHRLIDAIRDRHSAGESMAALARDYEMPLAVVRYFVRTPMRQLAHLRRQKA